MRIWSFSHYYNPKCRCNGIILRDVFVKLNAVELIHLSFSFMEKNMLLIKSGANVIEQNDRKGGNLSLDRANNAFTIITHLQRKCYNIMPERNLENDPWGVGGMLWGNSFGELLQFQWGFMVGTAREGDIHQPSQHRSGRLQLSHGLTLPWRLYCSPVSIPTADCCLFVGGILWFGPRIPPVSI